MTPYVCLTCGTQFTPSEHPLARCPICDEERQYIGHRGQRWTTVEELAADHDNLVKTHEPGLIGVGTVPSFAIGQRALLIQAPEGNVLWDCVTLVDETTVTLVRALGGISAIAISHPHYYSSMVEWARAFDAPVYLHEADRQWVMRPDASVRHWDGDSLELQPGITLVRTGGHFEGSTVLHWAAGAEGRGALLTGDSIQLTTGDRGWVTFMYSYPNSIPLPAWEVERIAARVEPYRFDRLYGAWWDRIAPEDGKGIVSRSAARYVAALKRKQPADMPA
jgi:glyoxylase-like metal-dependent hydrolase (beta-lactamase superfamily II)